MFNKSILVSTNLAKFPLGTEEENKKPEHDFIDDYDEEDLLITMV